MGRLAFVPQGKSASPFRISCSETGPWHRDLCEPQSLAVYRSKLHEVHPSSTVKLPRNHTSRFQKARDETEHMPLSSRNERRGAPTACFQQFQIRKYPLIDVYIYFFKYIFIYTYVHINIAVTSRGKSRFCWLNTDSSQQTYLRVFKIIYMGWKQ